MKKILALMITAILTVFCFAGCKDSAKNTETKSNNQTNEVSKLKIVTTIFPEYDWVCQILGDKADNAELTLLLDNGVDLHNYQPTADDIMKISSCDMFIYVGGESDEWVDDALQEASNKNMVVIDLLDVLGDSVKEEEVKEGMQDDEEEEEEEGEEEPEYDEHVWLSLKSTKTLCSKISDELCKIDAGNADTYQNNLKAYTEKLDKLDGEYQSLIDSAKEKTLIFGDRFPFGYFVDDYGLDYYAAFVGCSAETEASFETIVFLANKVDELGADTIFTIENSDKKIAETIISNTKSKNQKIVEFNSLQSVTNEQIESGTTYLSVMQSNYDVLKDALN